MCFVLTLLFLWLFSTLVVVYFVVYGFVGVILIVVLTMVPIVVFYLACGGGLGVGVLVLFVAV